MRRRCAHGKSRYTVHCWDRCCVRWARAVRRAPVRGCVSAGVREARLSPRHVHRGARGGDQVTSIAHGLPARQQAGGLRDAADRLWRNRSLNQWVRWHAVLTRVSEAEDPALFEWFAAQLKGRRRRLVGSLQTSHDRGLSRGEDPADSSVVPAQRYAERCTGVRAVRHGPAGAQAARGAAPDAVRSGQARGAGPGLAGDAQPQEPSATGRHPVCGSRRSRTRTRRSRCRARARACSRWWSVHGPRPRRARWRMRRRRTRGCGSVWMRADRG
jgi:hypothetical protein